MQTVKAVEVSIRGGCLLRFARVRCEGGEKLTAYKRDTCGRFTVPVAPNSSVTHQPQASLPPYNHSDMESPYNDLSREICLGLDLCVEDVVQVYDAIGFVAQSSPTC